MAVTRASSAGSTDEAEDAVAVGTDEAGATGAMDDVATLAAADESTNTGGRELARTVALLIGACTATEDAVTSDELDDDVDEEDSSAFDWVAFATRSTRMMIALPSIVARVEPNTSTSCPR